MTDKKFNIAVAGATGAVGNQMISCLEERNFPIKSIKFLASSRSVGRKLKYKGRDIAVEELTETSFKGIDIALFSAGGGTSEKFAPFAANDGCVVVDNSSAWRMDPEVPLVVPEVNPHAERLFDFAEYKSIPIVVNASSRTEAYKVFATDAEISASISAIFSILAERDNLPVIIHCSAGKDRAGGMSALVQLLLGVNRDDIMADYLLSRKAGKEVKAEWLQAALEQVEDEGGIEAFLSNRGIGRETQQAVRANLLRDGTDD